MFQFANLLLLALFAAALFDVVCAWRLTPQGPGHARRTLGLLWQQEHFLFGQWGAGWRQKAGLWVFCAALAAYEFNAGFCISNARYVWPWLENLLYSLECITFTCFSIKILFCTRYTWKNMAFAGCIYFIARWVYFNNHNEYWIMSIVAILAIKDLDLRLPFRTFMVTGCATMAITISLDFTGVIVPLEEHLRDGVLRPSFGYEHPNVFGADILGLCLVFIMLRAKKIRWFDIFVTSMLAIFLILGPSSRTPAGCLLLLALALAIHKLRPAFWQRTICRIAAIASVPALAIGSLALPLAVDSSSTVGITLAPGWLAKLDSILSSRIYYSWRAFQELDVRIAGGLLPEDLILDNCFVRALYLLGPIVMVLFFTLLAVALWGLSKSEHCVSFLVLWVMVLYCACDQQWFHLTSNPTLLLLCGAVYLLPLARWPAAEGEPPAA